MLARLANIALAFVLTLGLMPSFAWADEQGIAVSERWENPRLAVAGDGAVHASHEGPKLFADGSSSAPKFGTFAEGASYFHSQMANRVGTIAFQVASDKPESYWTEDALRAEIRNMYNAAIGDDEYLEYSTAGWKCTGEYDDSICTFTYSVNYNTTLDQEKYVDQQIASMAAQFVAANKDDYGKIKAAHDWICQNVIYDKAAVDDKTNRLKFTAYAVLHDHKAVCQGYALTFYRLCKQMGIGVHMISGTGDGEPHAWNIVRIDGQWYNVDTTWDEGRSASQVDYTYFLKGENDFPKHVRDEEYRTSAYATSATSYQRKSDVTFDLSKAKVTAPNMTYTGSALQPAVTVTLNGNVMNASNYSVTYANNVNVGTATVTVKGINSCTGQATGSFTISKPADKGATVYRLYNKGTGEHLWTTDKNEYDVLPRYGWTQEGAKWTAPTSGKGVYRLFNPGLNDHHYTSDTNETKVLTSKYGWVFDNKAKPLFYSSTAGTPVYRLYNKDLKTGQHLLTTDKNEYNVLPRYGWKQEGVAMYAL